MLISLDWLALSVYGEISQIPIDFSLQDTGSHSQIFASIYDVFYKSEKVASVQAHPFSQVVDKRLMVVKLENHLLYSLQDPIEFILFLCSSFNWKINNINRIDVCCDFQRLATGSPQDFISQLFDGTLHRKGDRKVVFHGRDMNQIDNIYNTKAGNKVAYFNKETNFLASQVTGYRAGSRASAVCVYMYNKSLELRTQKDKPYIRDAWRTYGLQPVCDTWRLEISLKGKAFSSLDLECFYRKNIVSTFAKLSDLYFAIYTLDDSTKPVRINVFSWVNVKASNIKLVKKQRKTGGDKSSRLFLSRLITELQAQHTNNEPNNAAIIDVLNPLIYEFAEQKNLQQYAKNKLLYLHLYETARLFCTETDD